MPHMIDRALVQEMQDRWKEGAYVGMDTCRIKKDHITVMYS